MTSTIRGSRCDGRASVHRVLLIEEQSGTRGLREELTVAGYELVVRAATGKLRLPLSALPDVIVLHAVMPTVAEELLDRVRAVGFDMPAVMVTPRARDASTPSYSYTIDGGALHAAGAIDLLSRLTALPRRTALERADETHDLPVGAEIRVLLDAELEVGASQRAGRRRAGAQPFGTRFQSRGVLASRTLPEEQRS